MFFQSEDFLELSGKISLIREASSLSSQKAESSLFSSLYSYIASGGGKFMTKIYDYLIQVIKKLFDICRNYQP